MELAAKWSKKHEEVVFVGRPTVIKRVFHHTEKGEMIFQIRKDVDVVMVAAFTAEGQVILVRQFRPGMEKEMIEVPAGAVDEGEEPIVAAARELKEETGFEGDMSFITSCYSAAYGQNHVHFFLAENCRLVSEQDLDDTEEVIVEIWEKSQVLDFLRRDQMLLASSMALHLVMDKLKS